MGLLEFWYEFSSTYSYPAAMRIERLAEHAGVEVVWRPFLLGPIFKAQGIHDSPFNIFAAKGRYMWRDLARTCEAGEADGWTPAFSRVVFAANYAEQKDISEDATLGAILRALGVDAEAALAEANAPPIKERLKDQTAEAAARGLFGAPSFTLGDELFWGNDRLEAALAFAKRG